MRILISILLFLFAFKSEGQIINASQPYRPVVASCSYLLDQYSGAAAAYSLRKLDCDYSGSAIRVRRSSDNTEQDIGFTSNGDLDTTSLKSFVSSNSGYITTWYDQSGNSSNATQSTAGNQPRIVNAGVVERQNGKLSMYFDGADFLNMSNISSEIIYSHFVVGTRPSTSVTFNSFGSYYSNGHPMVFILYNNNNVYLANSTVYRGASNNSNGNLLIDVHYNGSNSWQLSINNISITLSSAVSLAGGNYFNYIGRRNTDYTTGHLQEIIHYESDKSSVRTNIITNINSYYSIY